MEITAEWACRTAGVPEHLVPAFIELEATGFTSKRRDADDLVAAMSADRDLAEKVFKAWHFMGHDIDEIRAANADFDISDMTVTYRTALKTLSKEDQVELVNYVKTGEATQQFIKRMECEPALNEVADAAMDVMISSLQNNLLKGIIADRRRSPDQTGWNR